MNHQVVTAHSYVDHEIETILKTEEKSITQEMALSAKHKAERNELITESHFHCVCVEPATKRIQMRKHEMDQIILMGSKILNVIDFEESSNRELKTLTNSRHDAEKRIDQLSMRNDELTPDYQKIRLRKHLPKIAMFVMVCEVVFIYGALRHSFGFLQSLMIACACAFLTGALHNVIAHLIKKEVTPLQRRWRLCVILITAACAFSVLGFTRANAINTVPNINLEQHYYIPASPLSLTVISLGLFIGLLVLALYCWQSTAQRKEYEEYLKNEKEMKELHKEVKIKLAEEAEVIKTIIAKRNLARMINDYYESAVKKLLAIGNMGVCVFKSVYSSAMHITPSFFDKKIRIEIDESIPFSTAKNKTYA